LAGGSYNVSIVDKSTQPLLGDTILVLSTAVRSGAQSTVEVKLAASRPFRWSAFGDTAIDLGGDTYTDSYDSDSGTYAETVRKEDGDVGSNGEAMIFGTAEINGDVSTALPRGMTIDGSAQVTGDTTTSAPVQVLDPVSDEEIADAKLNSAAPGGISGDFTYNNGSKSFSVPPNTTATLSGGTYYFSSMDLKGSLVIEEGAQVKIYVTGDIKINAQFGSDNKPIDLQVYSTGDQVTINGGAELSAVIYAPDSEIKLTGGADLYGAFVGQSLRNTGDSRFHYDRSLRDWQYSKKLTKVSWRELTATSDVIELPDWLTNELHELQLQLP
jgi:hypothetical protein